MFSNTFRCQNKKVCVHNTREETIETMVEKGKYLVVVAVLEGRRFPKRGRHQLIAEAKFDGELLTTDPVDHIENPDITQELAWELDKKGLQQHRLQRTSIKIQCYAVDTSTSVKEAVGYVVLDLRSAHNKQTTKWYPLLLGKYQKNKPEIRLGLYLDEDKSAEENNTSFKAKEAPARLIEDTPVGEKDARLLKPVLNENEGYYQLGPVKQCSDQFVLSVTIATASNLTQLIPSTQPLSQGAGYFFYFSLFGNDVTNEVFHDLINPTFPAERASVRVRSSVEALRMFFTHQPGLQVHLCCGEQSLGRAEIPLVNLLKKSSTEIYMKPVSVEGSFELIPPNRAKQQMSVVSGGLSPVVGLSVVLRKEDMAMRTPVKEGQRTPIRSPAGPSPGVKHHQPDPGSPGKQQRAHSPVRREDRSPVAQNKDGDDYDDDFEQATNDDLTSLEEDRHKQGMKTKVEADQTEVKKVSASSTPQRPSRPSDSGTSTTQHHVAAIPPQSHHFAFSIDLRSIKSTDSSTTQNVFLRYTYPFFGSAAPILTHPPVEIRKGMEVLLPQSFCAFDFACNMQQLQETFLRVPLIVEMWNRDKQLSKDVLLGAARLPLGDIICAEKTKTMNDAGHTGWKQLYPNKVTVVSTEGPSKNIGEISFVLSLDDWGAIGTQQIVVAQPDSSGTRSMAETLAPVAPQEPRETDEYKAAMELEMWKEEQEHVFENQLKQKEMMYMKALAEEWKKRDRERELLMKKKLTEYAQLEEQLRKTLADLEKREKQLAANEQEVMRLRTDLQREHDRKLQEMKEASRRMKEDCDHQIELEKVKCREVESMVQRYKDELNEAEKRKNKIEKDFTVYKEELNTKPEVRLQSEINLLTLEKVELERKLDAVSKSKIHYKQQWGRALKELARLKQKEQVQAKAHLVKQQQELEQMRLRYLAAEEKEVVNNEKQELEDIKNELNKLKQIEEERIKSVDNSPRDFVSGKADPDIDNMEEHISRLIEERDTLLRTGVYSTQDRIIAELDRQIRDAMANKKLSNV